MNFNKRLSLLFYETITPYWLSLKVPERKMGWCDVWLSFSPLSILYVIDHLTLAFLSSVYLSRACFNLGKEGLCQKKKKLGEAQMESKL